MPAHFTHAETEAVVFRGWEAAPKPLGDSQTEEEMET